MNNSHYHEVNKERLREYNREYQKKYRAANREKAKAAATAYYAKNGDKERARNRAAYQRKRDWIIERKYGLTPEAYAAMLANQNGRCAICDADTPGGRFTMFHVDHCHRTGAVRGLLCNACNHLLGNARDNIETLGRAISYLTEAMECEILQPTSN